MKTSDSKLGSLHRVRKIAINLAQQSLLEAQERVSKAHKEYLALDLKMNHRLQEKSLLLRNAVFSNDLLVLDEYIESLQVRLRATKEVLKSAQIELDRLIGVFREKLSELKVVDHLEEQRQLLNERLEQSNAEVRQSDQILTAHQRSGLNSDQS